MGKSTQQLDDSAQPTQQPCDHVVGLDCDPGGYNAGLRTVHGWFEKERDWADQFSFCPSCGSSLVAYWKDYWLKDRVLPGPAERD